MLFRIKELEEWSFDAAVHEKKNSYTIFSKRNHTSSDW